MGAVRGRPDLDVQAPAGRQVHRRHRHGRRGGLLQLRPDVHPDRGRRHPGAVLVGHHGRLQGPEGRRPARPSRRCTSPARPDGANAVITLTAATSKFPAILGLPSFSIQSPTALEKYDANNVKAEGDSFTYPEYATEHPTGTGPFTFAKYDKANNTVELVRNDDYWGDKAKPAKLIFKIIPDETARKQELQAGTIDGYDLPNPADWDQLKTAGFNVAVRPAFNVLYLGINQKNNPTLQDLKVRQAIAYALNREQFVSTQLPEGAEVAKEFYPNTVDGYTDDVTQYAYDPDKAKSLLAEAGASRPDAELLVADRGHPAVHAGPEEHLHRVQGRPGGRRHQGQRVVQALERRLPRRCRRPDSPTCSCSAGPVTTTRRTTSSARFFSDPDSRFATEHVRLGQDADRRAAAADSEPDAATRNAVYVALNKKLMGEYLPAVPISHSPPALVVAAERAGRRPQPADRREVQQRHQDG